MPFEVPTEYAGVCFWMSEDTFLLNPPEQHVRRRGCLLFLFLRLSGPKTQLIIAITACIVENHLFHYEFFPHFQLFYFNDRLEFFE